MGKIPASKRFSRPVMTPAGKKAIEARNKRRDEIHREFEEMGVYNIYTLAAEDNYLVIKASSITEFK